jgi:hypothetical protein
VRLWKAEYVIEREIHGLFFRQYRKSFHDHGLNMRQTIVFLAIGKKRLRRSDKLFQIPSATPIESSFWDLSKFPEKNASVMSELWRTCINAVFRFSFFHALTRAEIKPENLISFKCRCCVCNSNTRFL